jgi:hypothetical protein
MRHITTPRWIYYPHPLHPSWISKLVSLLVSLHYGPPRGNLGVVMPLQGLQLLLLEPPSRAISSSRRGLTIELLEANRGESTTFGMDDMDVTSILPDSCEWGPLSKARQLVAGSPTGWTPANWPLFALRPFSPSILGTRLHASWSIARWDWYEDLGLKKKNVLPAAVHHSTI